MRYMETARLWMVAVMVAGIIGPTVASDQAWGADLPEVQQVQNEAAKGASGPSILFIGYRHGTTTGGATQRHFLRDLVQKHGFRVAYREQEFAYVNRPGNVDPAEFENYDVLVYLDPAWMPAEEGCLSETFAKQWAAAVEFVEKGGGLLFMPSVGESYRFSAQRCFEGLGLDLLAGIPVDAEGVAATVMEIRWSYTDRFDRQHPVMEDIRGLWVPAYRPEDREVWNANSVPFRVSGDWQVLARYGASVQVKPFEFHGPGRQLPTPTDADREAAPLLAVREFGQGRMGFFGVHSAYHIVGGRAPAYEDIFFNKGLKGHPSDGERLIVNLLNWLAEKALKSPDLGGAPTEPDAIARPEFKAVPPFEKPQDFAAQRPGFRGVIGALSPRSGGQSSVADYAAKARELGFDFLVVLDDLEKVNGELYQQLNAEAKAATTDDFVCIPGLRFRDEVGNRFVAFRHGLSFPTKVMLRENKRFTTLIREGERSSGTAGLGIAKWYQANEGRMAICFYRDSRDRESDDPYEYGVPPWDIRPYRSFHSVFTYDADGRLMDDMVEEHKVVVDDGQHPHPVAITFLKRAEDLQMVADGRLPHTVWWADELARLARRTDDAEPTHSAYLANTYATEGPRITRWQFDSRDLVSNGEYWDWTQYYQRWAMGVESDVGLDTVEVWDGKDLIRRYHPNGARRFDRVLVVNKHQLTMPFLIATDLNGKRAVTAGLRWRSHNFYVSWCGDRVNTLCYSALPSPESPWGSTAGTYPLPVQPKGPIWDNLRLDVNLDVLRFPGFDGQAIGGAWIRPGISVNSAEGQPRDGRLYRHITWPMASQEAVVQESILEHQLLPEQTGPHAWSTCGPIKPTDVSNGKLRYTTFPHYGHRPAPVLVEAQLTFKQDVRTDPKSHPFYVAGISGPSAYAGYRTVAVQRTGERDRSYSMFYDHRDRQYVDGPLPHGAYAWYFPSMFGPYGIISLTDGMHYRLANREGHKGVSIWFGEPGRSFKKGEAVRWKYLAVTSGFDDFSGIDTPERIIDLMGLDGSPGYRVQAVSGSVADSQYILTLKASEDGEGFRGTIKPSDEVRRDGLPAALPLVVQGLNDRWTAVLWDEAKKSMRPLPVAEGKAYAHYPDLREDLSIFIGHPFVCDDPEIVLTVVQTGPSSLYVYVHNPTDATRKVTVRRAADFDAMPDLKRAEASWTWRLAPGDERHVDLGPKTPWTPEIKARRNARSTHRSQ